jgi:Helix-turn-helix domain of resolvase
VIPPGGIFNIPVPRRGIKCASHPTTVEQRRLAVRRGAIEAESSKHKFDEGVITRSLELCLELLTSGQKHYEQADKLARRELNQAMFEHLYVDDDEIVASDMNEAFRRLISEDLAVELESERKTHQKRQTRTSGLYALPGVDENAHRGGEQGSWDLPPRARRTRPEDRIRPFLTLERPRGHLSWEKKEPRPSEDRGSNDLLLVVLTRLNLNTRSKGIRGSAADATPPRVRPRRRVTQTLREQVVAMYQKGGVSALQVAQELGLGKSTVLRILHDSGHVVRSQGRRLT